MRVINIIVKILTFPVAFLKGFWEQRLCKMMGAIVENKKIFQWNEMAGHIEHEPFSTAAKSFWFCFLSGFMVFLMGLIFAVPGILGCLYLDLPVSISKMWCISALGGAAACFSNIFPSIEDALMMWEKYKTMKLGARIILAPAAAIMYVGAYAETWGITFLVNHAAYVLIAFL